MVNIPTPPEVTMPKFVIEREMPSVGQLTQPEFVGAAAQSNAVLDKLPTVQWQHSYVTGDKLYCVYIAEDEDGVREHAELSGFPANKISRVVTILDPTSADA
ncbi:DUF4242 domain-containing protein [Antrihabitans stalactiti]